MVKKQAKPRGKVKARSGKVVKKSATKAKKRAANPAVKPVPPVMKIGRPTAKIRAARLDLFVQEYLKANFNGTKAAIACGYSPISARHQASELLELPEVNARIDVLIKQRTARVAIDADDVLKRMKAIAYADPRELIELHRCCCRFCYGTQHHYQWTPNELREALAEEEKQVSACNEDQAKLRNLKPVDAIGGDQFNPYCDPNPKCPECFGEGVERVVAKDTRDISPGAQMLYAGVKTTQNGMQVLTHDQAAMLVNVGKHLGMFVKNVKVDGAITHRNVALSAILDDVDGSGTGLPTDGAAD